MNSAKFMDKQITGLSGSQKGDFLEFVNPQEEHKEESKSEEILPCYDFQPIRPVVPTDIDGSSLSVAKRSNSAQLSGNSVSARSCPLQLNELTRTAHEKEWGSPDAIMTEIEKIIKRHADNLMLVLERVGAQMSQLEARTHHLESSFDNLKVSLGNNHGVTDGKLRQLENILREVQTTLQFLRDKQEIAEAQHELAKMHVSKELLAGQNPAQISTKQPVYYSQQSFQHPHSAISQDISPPLSEPLPPPVLSSQQGQAPSQLLYEQLPQHQIASEQLPQHQIASALAPTRNPHIQSASRQLVDPNPQSYQMQSAQSQLPLNQQYQISSQHSQYRQPSSESQLVNPHTHVPLTPTPHIEGDPYMAPQGYQPNIPPLNASPRGPGAPPSSLPFYGTEAPIYGAPHPVPAHSSSSAGYGPRPSGPSLNEAYSYTGSPGSSLNPTPHMGYTQLPTAQLLPHALPAACVGSSLSSSNSGNRVPIDDVIDKVATMGFSRDRVKATVKQLTENGQSVDLNVVLDKLMNDGVLQPQKGWFGR